jgi:hypothetical protein
MLTINEILDLIQTGKINESNLDSKDLIKIQFYRDKLNEEVYKNYITAYHRTIDKNEFLDKSNEHGFQLGDGGGSMYGVGLYGNYTWEGVHTEYSIKMYGKYIIKYIVKPNNILFFDEKTQIKIYGKPMSIVEQCNYWDIKLTDKDQRNIIEWQNIIKNENYTRTSKIAKSFYDTFLINKYSIKNNLKKNIYGISYNGINDRDTILMYDYRNVAIIGWYDETNGIKDEREMIPLDKTHNYYNSVYVSKNIINNTVLNNQNNIVKEKKSDIKKIVENYKKKLTKTDFIEWFIKNIISDETYYDQNHFFYNEHTSRIDYNRNKKNILIDYNSDIFYFYSKLLTFSLLDDDYFIFGEANSPLNITMMPKLKNIDIMFESVDDFLKIENLPNLISLKGIENVKINGGDYKPRLILKDLPSLKSLKYLPNSEYHLIITNCPYIEFGDDIPDKITGLTFNSDKKIISSKFNKLSHCKKLQFVNTNGWIYLFKNNKWVKSFQSEEF